jgi:hypothetical protein
VAIAAAVAEKCSTAATSAPVSLSGLDTATRAIEAAAAAAARVHARVPALEVLRQSQGGGEGGGVSRGGGRADTGADFLRSLRVVAFAIAAKPGPEAQVTMIGRLLRAARHVAPPGSAPLRSMRALLAAVPPELLGGGSQLLAPVSREQHV